MSAWVTSGITTGIPPCDVRDGRRVPVTFRSAGPGFRRPLPSYGGLTTVPAGLMRWNRTGRRSCRAGRRACGTTRRTRRCSSHIFGGTPRSSVQTAAACEAACTNVSVGRDLCFGPSGFPSRSGETHQPTPRQEGALMRLRTRNIGSGTRPRASLSRRLHQLYENGLQIREKFRGVPEESTQPRGYAPALD